MKYGHGKTKPQYHSPPSASGMAATFVALIFTVRGPCSLLTRLTTLEPYGPWRVLLLTICKTGQLMVTVEKPSIYYVRICPCFSDLPSYLRHAS